jgi:N-acetylmuramoyl-L-alanine amidase
MQIGNKNALIDDQEHVMPVNVQIVKGSTMVPLRFFCGTFLGCKIDFNAATKAITITDDNNTLIVQVGNPNAKLNGEEFRIQGAPPVIINGSLLVPFRFIGETFGCKVFYDSPTKTVKIVKYVYP